MPIRKRKEPEPEPMPWCDRCACYHAHEADHVVSLVQTLREQLERQWKSPKIANPTHFCKWYNQGGTYIYCRPGKRFYSRKVRAR